MGRCIILVLLFGSWMVPQRINAQTAPDVSTDPGSSTNSSSAGPPDSAGTDDSLDWLFPVHKLNRSLPSWFRIGGQYRGRLEGPMGIGFSSPNDFYFLDRLRVKLGIKPKEWLLFYGEVQDARIFFNHRIPNANPYEDKWTLWQAYSQVGSSETGWVDALAGRQVLRFGDERVIGPSEWLNVGRTFNVARIDVHGPGYNVSVFASSVVPGDNSDLHNALPGNKLYGVYGSFQNIVPKADFEPYVLWRVAPASSQLPETLNRGHLNEVTIGLHWKGDLPAAFDYDTEFDGQTGSLGASSIAAWAGYASVGKTFRKVAAAPRAFLKAITPLERKIRMAATGIPLTSSILRTMTSLALPIRLVAGTLCSSEPVSKKIPRKSGTSNSNLKATGWHPQMTTSMPAVGRLRLRPIPARAATSATNSIWLPNTR